MACRKFHPSPNRSRPPAFNELEAECFEEMCCALLDKEPEIRTADRYRTARQLQFGVDIVGELDDHSGIHVVSCKCYGSLRKGQLELFSNEFLPHWEAHWREKGVRRFVLCIATDIRSQQRKAEIREQRKRFRELGITYEVWGPRQLQEKLRPHPGIVSQFLGSTFVSILCGESQPASAPPASGRALLDNAIISQIAALQRALTQEVERKLQTGREQLRLGNRSAVENAITEIRNDQARWGSLPPESRARVLRLEALLKLEDDQISSAEALADDADLLALADEPRLRSIIAFHRQGPKAALQLLSEPKTKDGVNLRIAFLLEGNDPHSALKFLNDRIDIEQDAEACRLLAHTHLMLGNSEEALTAIRQAERIASEWVAIQYSGGVVRYAIALSPCLGFEQTAWPNPVPLDLVREDETSLGHLQEAATRFQTLITKVADEKEKQNLEAWRLACLANVRSKTLEAKDYFEELLGRNRTHAAALAWGLARGYAFDRKRARKALEDLLDSGRGEAEHVLALSAIHLETHATGKAVTVLGRYANRFKSERARHLLGDWKALTSAQAPVRKAQWPDSGTNPWAALPILVRKCRATDEWGRLISFAQNNSRDSLFVFAALQALANAALWEPIAQHKDLLINRVATAEAIRLAALATFNAGDPAASLSILHNHASAFPTPHLPVDLRRLQIAAHRRIGTLASAALVAADLAAETQATNDILTLIETKVDAGDLPATIPHIRQISQTEDLAPIDALMLSSLVRHTDAELARTLLRKACTQDIPAKLAGAALHLSLELGFHEEATPLYNALNAPSIDGVESSVKKVSIEDVVDIIRNQQKRVQKFTQVYLNGKAPIHLFSSEINANIARLFWKGFEVHKDGEMLSTFPLLIRNGSRRTLETFTIPFRDWNLILDLTALIIAAHLKLLDVIEGRQNPVHIPRVLPRALLQAEQDVRPHQPDRIEALRCVIKDVDSGRIKIAVTAGGYLHKVEEFDGLDARRAELLLYAQSRNGFLVDYGQPASTLPNECADRITTLRSIADGLLSNGGLDDKEHREALKKLGSYGNEPPLMQPSRGQPLIFYGNTVEVLAEAGLLSATNSVFEVFIDKDFLELAKDEVAQADEDYKLADWLLQLRTRIAKGINTGTYILLPHNPASEKWIEEGKLADNGAELCLVELLALPPDQDAVLWIDDRCCTGYSNSNGHPIVGVVDVLSALASDGLIDQSTQSLALRRLRAAGSGFLPITQNEVLYHLDQAVVENDRVVETPGLRVIRKNFALFLLLEDHLELEGPNHIQERKPDELWWLLGTYRAVNEIILAVWQREDLDLVTRKAWSEWAWKALRVQRFNRLPLHQTTEDGAKYLFALTLASLLSGAIQLPSRRDTQYQNIRLDYLDWLHVNIVKPQIDTDNVLFENIICILQQTFCSILEENSSEKKVNDLHLIEEENITKLFVKEFIDELPKEISRRVFDDQKITALLGIEIQTVVQFSGKEFSAVAFWRAAAKALAGEKTSLGTHDGAEQMALSAQGGSNQTTKLKLDGVVQGLFTDPILGVLSQDVDERLASLENNWEWLDYPPTTRDELISTITQTEPEVARIQALNTIRNDSAPFLYKRLSQALGSRQEVPWTYFHPPPAIAVARYMRVDKTAAKNLAVDLEKAGSALLEQIGAVAAFRRLSGLPVQIPGCVLDGIARLASQDAESALEELTSRSGSPLRRLHRIAAMRLLSKDLGLSQSEIQGSLTALIDDWKEETEAFVAILHWANRLYDYDQNWRSLPSSLRTATVWIHAEQVTSILLDAGAPMQSIARCFSEHDAQPVRHHFLLDLPYEMCVACPTNITSETLLLYGLIMAVGDNPAEWLTEKDRQELRLILTAGEEGKSLPKLALFQDYSRAANAIGSFFAGRPVELISCIAGFETSKQFDWDDPDASLLQALASIERSPNDPDGWFHLHVLRIPWLADPELERAAKMAVKVELVQIVKSNQDVGLALGKILAELAASTNCPELRASIADKLENVAEFLSSEYPRLIPEDSAAIKKSGVFAADKIGQAALLLSKSENGRTAVETFSQLLWRLGNKWQAAIPFWRRATDRFIRNLPFEWTRDLWELYVKLQAYD